MLKRIIRTPPVQWFLGVVLAFIMWLGKATTRWEVVGRERVEPIWAAGGGVIGCVWHARVLMTIAGWPKDAQPATMLISRSPDGAFVARAAKAHGVGVIRGSARNKRKSKEKGGATAFRAMMEHVRSGGVLCVTPDGPRGPRMRAQLGSVRLAQATQAPMLVYAWSSSRRIVFNSWDRFTLALPFGRGVIVWRGPLDPPPPDADAATLEAARLELENELNAATQEADRRAGVEVIEPAVIDSAERAPASADPATPGDEPAATPAERAV